MKVLLLLLFCCCYGDSYKILGIFPHFGKSHFDIFAPLMRGLAERGNDVTVLSYFPLSGPVKNYRDLVLKTEASGLTQGHLIGLSELPGGRLQRYSEPWTVSHFAQDVCRNGLRSKEVKKLLESKEKFDLIVVEAFNTDCFLGLVHKLNSPFVQISSSRILPWFYSRFGLPSNPSYIPSIFLGFSDNMQFFQRLENFVLLNLHRLVYKYYLSPRDHQTVCEILGDVPPLEEIAKNASLFLINSHFSMSRPAPLNPAVVEISGIHLPKPKKLPVSLENWINESKAGVIYFSMGSMIKGHTFPEDKRQSFLRAFARLNQRVLWKWENDSMPGKPENLMIQKWMPQFDILCHPNVKAYIAHGGLLGMTEAVHCGVPAVVLPQFGDQYTNAQALQASGGGVVLDFNTVDEEQVYQALKTILSPEFQAKTKQLSERFRDRPMPPLETAIYWIEYVARHKGADHMRTAAVGMPFYQYLLLDVVLFLAVAASAFVAAVYLVCRKLCCRRKTVSEEKKKK